VPQDRTGLLIIRAWIEPGSVEPLRAHLRVTSDVANGFERTETFSNPGDVEHVVTRWLAQVASA
jgi:hypothetical protein